MFEGRTTLREVEKRGHWGSGLSVKQYEKHALLLKGLNEVPAPLRNKAAVLNDFLGRTLLRDRSAMKCPTYPPKAEPWGHMGFNGNSNFVQLSWLWH